MSLVLMLGALAACGWLVLKRRARFVRLPSYVGPEFAANVELQAEFLSHHRVAAKSSRAA